MSNLTNRPISEGAEKLINLYFPVLDHGFVALKDYLGSDEEIAQAARCSYGAGTRSVSDNRNLIRYLVRHLHTSPLEQVEVKLHCKMPIMVARQWVRHRTANLNEMSGRYSLMPLQFYTPELENFSTQSKDNKQGRSGQYTQDLYNKAIDKINNLRENIQENYEWMLAEDVARELARIDLPLSTYTEWYWKIDLHNFLHFLKLRCDGHAQWEIRAFANIMAGMVKLIAPAAYEAWIDYNFSSFKLSFQECKALGYLMNSGIDPNVKKVYPKPEEYKEWGEKFGLSKREVEEFFYKINSLSREYPDFTLDLSTAKSAEYFLEESKKYLPKV